MVVIPQPNRFEPVDFFQVSRPFYAQFAFDQLEAAGEPQAPITGRVCPSMT